MNKIFLLCIIVFIIILCIYNKSNKECFTDENKPKKIAFLFLIYDEINHEDMWYNFFKNIDKNKYNIYIHYKNDKKLKYFDHHKLKNCIPTAWGHISLVRAMNLLLKEALMDPLNQNFIFVSNSCIPLKSFNTIYNKLDPNFSYFSMMKKDDEIIARCKPLTKYIDNKYIRKASQWCILNRKHADILVNDHNNIIEWFNFTGCVPDEHYYITFLHYFNMENELIKIYDNTENFTTFVVWFDLKYKYKKTLEYNYPKTYTSISQEELDYLTNSPCLFGRKFHKDCKMIINYN